MKPVIQVVCGFGIGSSLMLKIQIDEILSKNNLEADTLCSDLATCLSNKCDVIFISRELVDRIEDRAEVPIVIVDNFMDKNELENKVFDYFKSLGE